MTKYPKQPRNLQADKRKKEVLKANGGIKKGRGRPVVNAQINELL